MQLFQYIDEALLRAEKRVEYAASEPRVWPSEASAVSLDTREAPIVGKCHRASFFRLTGEPITYPSNAKAARRFRMGRACEDDITRLAKDAGIHVANGVRCFVPSLILPFELDLVVLNPETNQGVIVENKSNYGYFAKKDMEAGKPKIAAIMQACMYLMEVPDGATLKQLIRNGYEERQRLDAEGKPHRNRIEVTLGNLEKMDDGPIAAKLAYESRDECDTWEFNVSVHFDEENGTYYPAINSEPWKIFTLESIYERYRILQDYWYRAREEGRRRLVADGIFPPPDGCDPEQRREWDELIAAEVRQLDPSWWPPAEFEFRYSPEKIDFLAAEGLITKRRYSDYLKRVAGKETIGSWNCQFCSYRTRCVSIEYPELRSMALDLMQDEEVAA
jgi:hypothetical protein